MGSAGPTVWRLSYENFPVRSMDVSKAGPCIPFGAFPMTRPIQVIGSVSEVRTEPQYIGNFEQGLLGKKMIEKKLSFFTLM